MTLKTQSFQAKLRARLAGAIIGTTCAFAIASGAIALDAAQAHAETITSDANWTVTFTADKQMESNFDSGDITEFVGTMQPGDTANMSVALRNLYSTSTDWYMTNKIISSLEESATSANGGAYSYTLIYTDPSGNTSTLFSNDEVGGDQGAGDRSGLTEATSALEDYFLLGTIPTNGSAAVSLTVALDGETQGNAYQDTLADLSLDFAVEPTGENTIARTPGSDEPSGGRLQQTGDTNMLLIALCSFAGLAGLVLLVVAIVGRRKQDAEEVEVG